MDIAIWVAVLGGLFSLSILLVGQRLESQSANIAILAEVQRLLKVLERHKDWWEACIRDGKTDQSLVPFSTPVFAQQVKTIGSIDREIVAKIVAFYGYVEFINSIQREKTKYTGDREKQFNSHYAGVLVNILRDYKGTFDIAFTKHGLRS